MNESIIDEVGVSQGAIRCPYWLSIEKCASDCSSRTYSFPRFYYHFFFHCSPFLSFHYFGLSPAAMLPFVYKTHTYTFFLSSGINPPHSSVGPSRCRRCHAVLLSSPPVVVQFHRLKFPQIEIRAHEKRRAGLTTSNPTVHVQFYEATHITPFRSSLSTDVVQTYLRRSLGYSPRPSHTHTPQESFI